MSYIGENLLTINTLRDKIEAYGLLSQSILRRIEYRFRLECNYYSNRQEGGTLTRQETRTVMIDNITVDGKPLKDIREMKGHDQVMIEIIRLGKGEVRLAEKRVKDIHRTIIVQSEVEKTEQTGEWKKAHNEIINYQGEKFSFLPPNEVPDAMHQLLNWLNAELEKVGRNSPNTIHPAVLAFEFQHRFLTIHPFHDGNGRTARLLSNLILTANGYPPIYITDEEKDAYNRYLGEIQGYGGNPDLFVGFMCDCLKRSLELTLDVIEGREDQEDWEKELSLLVTQLPSDQTIRQLRSPEVIKTIIEDCIFPVIASIQTKVSIRFDDLFLEKEQWFGINTGAVKVVNIEQMRHALQTNPVREDLYFLYELTGFKRPLREPFSVMVQINWHFDNYSYWLIIKHIDPEPRMIRYYHQQYSPAEIKEITARCGEYLLRRIQAQLHPGENE